MKIKMYSLQIVHIITKQTIKNGFNGFKLVLLKNFVFINFVIPMQWV